MKATHRAIAAASGAATAVAAFSFAQPGAPAQTNTTTLLALVAANAMDPFNDIAKEFEAAHSGVGISAEFGGTQVLETQLEQGAPADLFLSADLAHIKRLAAEGLIGDYFLVSKGHEVIVVPADNPAQIASLEDLADKPVKLVIGNETVPIGIYTRQILQKAAAGYSADFPQRVLAHAVSLESNVKQILEKVALGEADAGIVYRTDVTPEYAAKVKIIEIPTAYEVESANYIAVVNKSANRNLASAFVQLTVGTEGQAVFARYGYDKLTQ